MKEDERRELTSGYDEYIARIREEMSDEKRITALVQSLACLLQIAGPRIRNDQSIVVSQAI
jgi:hypothetical protein